jgi:hypothetical protein
LSAAVQEVGDVTTGLAANTYTTPLPLPGEPWLVIRTAPRLAKTLVDMAEHVGARLWVPVYARRTRVGPQRKITIDYPPVFPGYAFVPRSHARDLTQIPTRRYQFLRTGFEMFVHVGDQKIVDMAKDEAKWCNLGTDPKPIEQFAVGDVVQPSLDLFGPMEVVGIVGSTLELEMGGFRLRVSADAAQKVA